VSRDGSQSYRVLVVDDEELARDVLREMLAAHPEVSLAAECADGFEAAKAAADHRPDIVFLDVQMPKLDGFEVLELLDPSTAVVFVTAYDEYALRAFDVNAVDYLLKPYSPERFEEALERAKQRVGREAAPPAAHLAAAARPEGQALERIVVRDGASVQVIPVERLDYAEAQDDYVALWSGGRSFLKQQTLASLEAGLARGSFVRIHRSYLLRLDRLAKIEPVGKDTREAVLRDGTRLPVSRSGYQRLRGALGER
jgi:two-component system LytT family response regulator